MIRGERHGVYLVTGRRKYRGHDPGTTFEAALERGAERRALQRGDIRLIRRVTPALPRDSYQLPADWLAGGDTRKTEAPKAPLLMPEGR